MVKLHGWICSNKVMFIIGMCTLPHALPQKHSLRTSCGLCKFPKQNHGGSKIFFQLGAGNTILGNLPRLI